jgi:hypothetical protein
MLLYARISVEMMAPLVCHTVRLKEAASPVGPCAGEDAWRRP